MNGPQQICHCGHDIDTHHEKGKADCLGIGCNVDPKVKDCPFFRCSNKPDTWSRDDAAPSTQPIPSWNFPI